MNGAPTGSSPTGPRGTRRIRQGVGAAMVSAAALLASPLVGLAAPLLPAGPTPAKPLANAAGADCVTYEKDVRYGALGYDHRVMLTSACERSARCAVSASSNPEPQRVSVAAGATDTVLVARGSPAREFTATVRCELED